jgi:uncharacterized protein (DUF4415 family)
MKKPNPELIDDENPELDEAWFKRAKPVHEVLQPTLLKKLGIRGPQKAPTKERITIRLSHDVVERFRSTGDGWQTRVDAALQDWIKTHSLG